MPLALTYADVKKLNPCADDFARIAKAMGADWKKHGMSAADARKAGATFEDIVWIASAAAGTDPDIERRLRLWLADCAAHVVHNFERQFADDSRIRECIEASRAFARGQTADAARSAAWSEADAARSAAWSAAWSAADAAWSEADAARSAAWSEAKRAEQDWQFDCLMAWLSDSEPADWPLPEMQKREVAAA